MKPACMTDVEWGEWNAPLHGRAVTGHPCFDCPREFHLAQREAGSCDGFPMSGGRRRLTYAPTTAQERRREQWRQYRARKRAVA